MVVTDKEGRVMNKKLVAYFSATGITKKVAKRLAEYIGADLFEIKPEVPYTAADLDWTNQKSRSSIEMSDKAFRPALADKVEDISKYDVIYVGFPIWWYVAPTIINTFLECHNLSGKAVILFATSGGSGFGNTIKELKSSCNAQILREGKIINALDIDSQIRELFD